jgi:hypothetical protein
MDRDSDSRSDESVAAQQQQAPGCARKSKSGAPKGNRNRVTHGAYLSEKKRTARELRDKYRRRGERVAREMLRELGLTDSPLARGVAKDLGRLEALAFRLETWLDARGWFKRDGELKSAVTRYIDVLSEKLGDYRRLLDQLPKASSATGITALILQADRLRKEREAEAEREAEPEPKPPPPTCPEPSGDATDDGRVARGVVAAVQEREAEPADLADAVRRDVQRDVQNEKPRPQELSEQSGEGSPSGPGEEAAGARVGRQRSKAEREYDDWLWNGPHWEPWP